MFAVGVRRKVSKNRCARAENEWFDRLIIFCIVASTIAMGMEYEGMSDDYSRTLEYAEVVFTVIFTIEMLLKIWALGGLGAYLSDRTNKLDFLIVWASLISMMPQVCRRHVHPRRSF